ncbi:MAG TPA: helix-turn-helix domain-containing protein [bacterium]|nr:helix-turn-helix domain-containing protein [bacterium]
MTPQIAPTYLTQKETAEELRVSPRTLEKWRRSGRGPRFIRYSQRAIRYDRDDVRQWAESRKSGGEE